MTQKRHKRFLVTRSSFGRLPTVWLLGERDVISEDRHLPFFPKHCLEDLHEKRGLLQNVLRSGEEQVFHVDEEMVFVSISQATN